MIFVWQNSLLMIAGIFVAVVICYIYKKKQLVHLSEWQYKEQPVTQDDLQILHEIIKSFPEQQLWDKYDDRFCVRDEKQSLFCLTVSVSKEITGNYLHRGVVTQELRLTIEELFPDRWTSHPIMDFNNHSKTTTADVLKVLNETSSRLEGRLQIV